MELLQAFYNLASTHALVFGCEGIFLIHHYCDKHLKNNHILPLFLGGCVCSLSLCAAVYALFSWCIWALCGLKPSVSPLQTDWYLGSLDKQFKSESGLWPRGKKSKLTTILRTDKTGRLISEWVGFWEKANLLVWLARRGHTGVNSSQLVLKGLLN